MDLTVVNPEFWLCLWIPIAPFKVWFHLHLIVHYSQTDRRCTTLTVFISLTVLLERVHQIALSLFSLNETRVRKLTSFGTGQGCVSASD